MLREKGFRLSAAGLALALLLTAMLLGACGGKAEEDDPNVDAAVDALFGMQPIIQSVEIYSELFGEDFRPSESSCFWRTMWILVNTYGSNNPEVIFDLSGISVPRAQIETYAAALSSEYSGNLPGLPEGTTIVYDSENDIYIIPWSEAWLRAVNYDKVSRENGNYVISASLLDLSGGTAVDGGAYDTPAVLKMDFELTENRFKAEENPEFEFSLLKASMAEE